MNITLGTGKAVHTPEAATGRPLCGTLAGDTRATCGRTDANVTCKRCLKLIAAREAAAERTDYYAGLRDAQDETLSQAEPVTEDAPAAELCGAQVYDPFRGVAFCTKAKLHDRTTAEGPEHQGNYDEMDAAHAAALAEDAAQSAELRDAQDEILSRAEQVRAANDRKFQTAVKEAMFEQTVPTVGLDVATDAGRVPGTAELVSVTTLAWVPGMSAGTVTTAGDGVTFWVYAQFDGRVAELLYIGRSHWNALSMHGGFVSFHEDRVHVMATNMAGVRVTEPTESVTTVYGDCVPIALR